MNPYDNEGQYSIQYAPWQVGTELYEAYGRFLDRMANGGMPDDDGGWCDQSLDGYLGGSNYEANMAYTEEAELDAYLKKQALRQRQGEVIARKALRKQAAKNKKQAAKNAHENLVRASIIKFVRESPHPVRFSDLAPDLKIWTIWMTLKRAKNDCAHAALQKERGIHAAR